MLAVLLIGLGVGAIIGVNAANSGLLGWAVVVAVIGVGLLIVRGKH
jgi:hypothetical protein